MIFQKSELELIKFNLLELNYKIIVKESVETDIGTIHQLLQSLPIEIEFFLAETEKEFVFNIFCRIFINKDNNEGYNIFAEGVGIFTYENAKTKKIEAHSGNALGITINKIRESIFYSTSTSPYGSYQLPLVDLQKIIDLKNKPDAEN